MATENGSFQASESAAEWACSTAWLLSLTALATPAEMMMLRVRMLYFLLMFGCFEYSLLSLYTLLAFLSLNSDLPGWLWKFLILKSLLFC